MPFNIEDSDYQCELLGGYLAELNDRNEYYFVFNYVKDLEGIKFMTGGNDREVEGKWKFYHSQTDVIYPNWYRGQPDSAGGNEDCLMIRINFGASNDAPCDVTAKFICEVPA